MDRRAYLGLLITVLAGCGGPGRWGVQDGGTAESRTTVAPAGDPGQTTGRATGRPPRTRTDTPTEPRADTDTATEPTGETDTPTETETDAPTETTSEEPEEEVSTPAAEHLSTARSELASVLEEYASYAEGGDGILAVTATVTDFPSFVGDEHLVAARDALDAAVPAGAETEPEAVTRLRSVTATLEAAITVQAAIVGAHDDLAFGIDRLGNGVGAAREWVDRAMDTRNEASDAFETLETEYTESDARALPALRTDIYQRKYRQLVTEYESFEHFQEWLRELGVGIDYLEEAEQNLAEDEHDIAETDAERATNTFQRILDEMSFRGIPDSMGDQGDTLRSVIEDYHREARELEEEASRLST